MTTTQNTTQMLINASMGIKPIYPLVLPTSQKIRGTVIKREFLALLTRFLHLQMANVIHQGSLFPYTVKLKNSNKTTT